MSDSARAGRVAALAAATLALAASGAPALADGGPERGAESYGVAAEFGAAGKPRDVLVHPDSGKLYVGSDDNPDTEADERGLHTLDPGTGKVRGLVAQAPGPTGALRASAVARVAAPLPGDGVLLHYLLRGIGTAKDGDAAVKGVWLAGSSVTDVGPGVTPGTTLVAQGAKLSEVETATGTFVRSLTLPGGGRFAVDTARKTVWFADFTGRQLSKVDAASFTVTASVKLAPSEDGSGFVETDPETGAVWVGVQKAVYVFDPALSLKKTLQGGDYAKDAAFDRAAHRAYVVWQDGGSGTGGDDNTGALTVYGTGDYEEAVAPVPLPGNHGQLGAASVAVQPGGDAVYVTNPAQGRVTKLERRVAPKVTGQPVDRSVKDGESVTFTAAATGTPAPSVRWQASKDGGRSWAYVAGETTATYTFTAKADRDGHRFRAEFANEAGTAHTAAAALKVTAAGDGDGDTGSGSDGGQQSGGASGAPGSSGSTGSTGSTGSSGTSGASGTSGSTDGAAGTTGTSGTTGGSTGSSVGGSVGGGSARDAHGSGGSLAATGASTALPLAAASAGLLALGWVAYRRGRRA